MATVALRFIGVDFNPLASTVRFFEDGHRYVAGSIALPSVTQILRGCGISTDFDALVREGKLKAAELAEKRELGRAVHAAAHYYDEGALVRTGLDPRIEPYLQAWVDFREQTGFTPALLETPLWHPGHLVAGQIDRAGYFARFAGADPEDLNTVDIKLGSPEDAAAEWQTAAYAEMLAVSLAPIGESARLEPRLHPNALRLRPRYSVQLFDTGRFKLHKYDNHVRAWSEFCSFVTTFRRQRARRAA
jgi:hypothetical protein